MSTTTARRLLVAALAAGSLLLAGCDQATGQQGGTSLSGGCDPHGFGPFSGCGSKGTTKQTGRPVAGKCDPHGFGPFSGCGNESTQADEADQADPDQMATSARHEAWHKAVADEYGWPVSSVTLHPDGSGDTSLACCGWPEGATLDQKLTFLLAGQASSEDEGNQWGSLDDFKKAAELLEQAGIPPAEKDQKIAEAKARAARIATARSGQVARDVAGLLRNRSLG